MKSQFWLNIWNSIKKGVNKLSGFFDEKSGLSMMRFMSFFMFWFAIYEINYIVVKYGMNLDANQLILIGVLLTFAFFPKVAQKVIERKYDIIGEDLSKIKTKKKKGEEVEE